MNSERAASTRTSSAAEVLEQASLRQHNMRVVLRYLRDLGPASRADLASATQLTRTGIANIVEELMELELVEELGQVKSGTRGRPATPLIVAADAAAAIGLEINAFHSSLLVTDLVGSIIYRERSSIGTDSDVRSRVTAIEPMLRRGLEAASRVCRTVAGIAVAIPGAFTPEGCVTSSALGWKSVNIAEALRPLLPAGTRIDAMSIGRFAALAEVREQSQRGEQFQSLMHFEVGASIGVSLVVEGVLQRGANSTLGSIAHINVDPDGDECRCGRRGCLETVVSLRTLLRHAAPDLLKSWGQDSDFFISEIISRAESGRADTLEGLEAVGGELARALAIPMTLLDPEVVVLGGYPQQLAKWLMPVISDKVRPLVGEANSYRLTVSPLGTDAGLVGATQMIRDSVFEAPGEFQPSGLGA